MTDLRAISATALGAAVGALVMALTIRLTTLDAQNVGIIGCIIVLAAATLVVLVTKRDRTRHLAVGALVGALGWYALTEAIVQSFNGPSF